jgi:hypothetical protein
MGAKLEFINCREYEQMRKNWLKRTQNQELIKARASTGCQRLHHGRWGWEGMFSRGHQSHSLSHSSPLHRDKYLEDFSDTLLSKLVNVLSLPFTPTTQRKENHAGLWHSRHKTESRENHDTFF